MASRSGSTTPRVLGIVPARSGSTRIPNKNLRPLGGRPLINWSIDAARQANCLESLIVSTDSAEIAEVARAAGAEVPWLRSAKLATDTADVVEAVLEVLDLLDGAGAQMPDAVMLLQPTSPFRTSTSIRGAFQTFAQAGGKSVVSVCPARSHPLWCRQIDESGLLQPYVPDTGRARRSQDLPMIYALNGAIYVATPTTLRSERSFYSSHTVGFVMPSQIEAIDIDTPEDWLIADAIARAGGTTGGGDP